jgi:hypothetical protein
VSEQQPFWRLVAGSRVLQARAGELAEDLEAAVAAAFRDRGVNGPELCAALVAAAYRSVHLDAIRSVLAGEPPENVATDRAVRLGRAFDAVEQAATRLQTNT